MESNPRFGINLTEAENLVMGYLDNPRLAGHPADPERMEFSSQNPSPGSASAPADE
jgi:hypothetical protein